MIFGILTLLFVGSVVFHCFYHFSPEGRKFNKIPGPRVKFVAGNSLDFPGNQARFFSLGRSYANIFKTTYRYWILNRKAVNLLDPDDCEVLLSNAKNIKKGFIYKFTHEWLNDGLLTSSGAKWQTRRKILTPAFHFNILRQFCPTFSEGCEKLVQEIAKNEKAINILPIISKYALHFICETAMGTKLDKSSESEQYIQCIQRISYLIIHRILRFWLYVPWLFSLFPEGKLQRETIRILHNFTDKVIKERRLSVCFTDDQIQQEQDGVDIRSTKKRLAMLDLLLSAERKGLIDHNGIREEVDTFMFEGHDTTAMATTFCLMEIANNVDIQNKIYEEINNIYTDSDSLFTIESLNKMEYLEMVIKEGLRLHPSVTFFGRVLSEDLQFKNFTLPAGTECFVVAYDLHRREDLYPNPLKFDPERFTKENCQKRHPFAYIPFSAGPRNCIGQKYALLEMKAIIASLIRNFKLVSVTRPEDIIFKADLVLKCMGQIKMKFIPRD